MGIVSEHIQATINYDGITGDDAARLVSAINAAAIDSVKNVTPEHVSDYSPQPVIVWLNGMADIGTVRRRIWLIMDGLGLEYVRLCSECNQYLLFPAGHLTICKGCGALYNGN